VQCPGQDTLYLQCKGEVYSYSTVHHPPEGFEQFAPYVVALVRLAEGPLVAAQLTDVEGEKIEIGMPVEMVTRKLRDDGGKGTIVYGYKFRPVSRRRGIGRSKGRGALAGACWETAGRLKGLFAGRVGGPFEDGRTVCVPLKRFPGCAPAPPESLGDWRPI